MSHGARLAKQVAVVTGGLSGFGKAIADTFLQHGAKVLVMDLNAKSDGALGAHPANAGQQMRADACNVDDWRAAVQVSKHHFGRAPTICINNAGWTYANKSTLTVTQDDFDKVLHVNLRSIFASVSVLVPEMQREQQQSPGNACFVQIASTAGVRPRPNLTWYNASKAAVITASRSMALEFAKDKIRFNCINPVAGHTPMLSLFAGSANSGDAITEAQLKQFNDSVPLGRLSMPSDVANAALFLADPASEYITGVDLNIDGGRCV